MANTTNFGWETPDDTDLVKDGAAAMRTLGNSIDASFIDLKGGTTGQVLAKASNTDLDFTWTNGGDITAVTAGVGLSGGGTSGDVTLTNTVATTYDAKGDLVVGTGADTFDKLVVGSNNQVLVADSSTATGLKWSAAPSPASANALTTGNQSTSSSTYTDLSTVTSVTLTTGTKALVIVSSYMIMSAANTSGWVSYAVSGASSISATDQNALMSYFTSSDQEIRASAAHIVTGLTAGSNTFTMKFRKAGTGGNPSFGNRSITVIDLGS